MTENPQLQFMWNASAKMIHHLTFKSRKVIRFNWHFRLFMTSGLKQKLLSLYQKFHFETLTSAHQYIKMLQHWFNGIKILLNIFIHLYVDEPGLISTTNSISLMDISMLMLKHKIFSLNDTRLFYSLIQFLCILSLRWNTRYTSIGFFRKILHKAKVLRNEKCTKV